MKRSIRIVAALAAAALFAYQFASWALFGPLGREPSFPRAIAATWPFAAAQALGLDRNSSVRTALARAALVRDDDARAAALLAPLADDADVEDLRGRIALAGGDVRAAVAQFGGAGDLVRARSAIDALAARDPSNAALLAALFYGRVADSGAPADVTAESAWRAGRLAAEAGRPRQALAFYRAAVARDPAQETYLLALGFQLLAAGDAAGARDAYARAAAVVPDSVDALVGRAVSEARMNQCGPASADLRRSRALASAQHRVVDVASDGYDATSRAAVQRCR